ncbi:MAG: tyrosine-protein phosphatase [Caldilineaceae bacterium]
MTHLAWDGCYNVRDLSGLPLAAGGQIHPAALIRSDILSRLSAAGRQALIDYGVGTVIDLRTPAQVAEEPSAFAPGHPQPGQPHYHILSLENRNVSVINRIDNAPSQAEKYCLTVDYCQPEVAEIVRAVAEAQTGGVLIHCHAGKDRTGIVIALLLGLVGVTDEAIAADYAASEERLWPLFRQMEAAAADDPAQLTALQHKIPTALPQTIQTLLTHLRIRYDSIRGYLLAAGVTEDELARIEHRLVEKADR